MRTLATVLVVLAVDWTTKFIAIVYGHPVYHYTHPNPLVFLSFLLIPLVLRKHPNMAIPIGLGLGGAAGNILQRMLGQPVTDWIPLGGYIWNLADFAIIIGSVCLVLNALAVMLGVVRHRQAAIVKT